MDEEKVYLTMSAVGNPDEIIQALTELLTTIKTTPIYDIRNLSTYGNQVLVCSKKQYALATNVSQQKNIGKV